MRRPLWRSRAALTFASALALLAASLPGARPCAAQGAETILLNGKVVTLDERSSVVQALAIRDERILAVGASADIPKVAGADTRVIDLGGRTVIPGLIDSHIHAIRAGLKFSTEASWIGVKTIAEAMDRIRVAAPMPNPAHGSWSAAAGRPDNLPSGGGRPRPSSSRPRRIIRFMCSSFYRAVLLTPLGEKALGYRAKRSAGGRQARARR